MRIAWRILRGAFAACFPLVACFDFAAVAGAFWVFAGACALGAGVLGLGVLVGVCAHTGAAIRAARATPLNRRIIVSASRGWETNQLLPGLLTTLRRFSFDG